MNKAYIWCEVSCGKCGNTIGFYYKNLQTISMIKEKSKGWKWIDGMGNICPNCYEKLRQEKDHEYGGFKGGK